MNAADLAPFLAATRFLDIETPSLTAFVREAVGDDAASERERAVRLFHAVRDGIRYDPYATGAEPEHFRASGILERKAGFCVPKAIALAACARASGIPSRLGFADVRNHLATQRLRERMGTDVFVFHGYAELHLGGRWVKATPTFDLGLCERFRVRPLDFDGEADALFHPFDRDGREHMQYLRARGEFADFPLEAMLAAWREGYPHLFGAGTTGDDMARHFGRGDFHAEAAAENASRGDE